MSPLDKWLADGHRFEGQSFFPSFSFLPFVSHLFFYCEGAIHDLRPPLGGVPFMVQKTYNYIINEKRNVGLPTTKFFFLMVNISN